MRKVNNHALPFNVSWSVVLDEIIQFVVIQEGSGHVPAQFHI